MSMDDLFKTRTMAKIFVKQGRLKKAAQIYVFLIKKNPKPSGLKKELAEIMHQLRQNSGKTIKDLRPLYGKWIALGLTYHKMKSRAE